jgi:hypothetical protein
LSVQGDLLRNGLASHSIEEAIATLTALAYQEGAKPKKGSSGEGGSPQPQVKAPFTTALEGVTDLASLNGAFGQVEGRVAEMVAQAQDPVGVDEERANVLLQGRAAGAAVLEAIAVRVGQLDATAGTALLLRLGEVARAEPHTELGDFIADRVVGLTSDAGVDDLEQHLYPVEPPYDHWLGEGSDGSIDIVAYIDDDGTPLDRFFSWLRTLGFSLTQEESATEYLFRLKGVGQSLPISIRVPKPVEGAEPGLFEHMANPAVDAILVSGHNHYGRRVDHAVESGVVGSGDGKLVILYQCSAVSNVEEIERAYPQAQVVSVIGATDDGTDMPNMARILQGLRLGESWEAISLGADANYFYPNDRSVLSTHYDRDRDGVVDQGDGVYNVVLPKAGDASGGLDPVVQSIPDYALSGEDFDRALDNLDILMGIDLFVDSPAAPWRQGAIVGGGFFQPEAGDLSAFHFEVREHLDPASGKTEQELVVQLSTRFAHTPERQLCRMLAYEAGIFLGKLAFRDPITGEVDSARCLALALATLSRAIHQQGADNPDAVWYGEGKLLKQAAIEEGLLYHRYGLEALGLSLADVKALVGIDEEAHEDGAAHHLDALADRLAQIDATTAVVAAPPAAVGEMVEIPSTVGARSFEKSVLEVEKLGPRLTELGIPGKVASVKMDNGGDGFRALVRMEDAGKASYFSLIFDEGKHLVLASRLPIDGERVVAITAEAQLTAFARAQGLAPAPLIAVMDKALAGGATAVQALIAAIRAARRAVPPGTVVRFDGFQKAANLPVLSDKEGEAIETAFSNFFDQSQAEVEKAFFAWADGWVAAGGVADAQELRTHYLELLAGEPSIGIGKAIDGVLAGLKGPAPAGAPPFPITLGLQLGGLATGWVPKLRALGIPDSTLLRPLFEHPEGIPQDLAPAMSKVVDAAMSAGGSAVQVIEAMARDLQTQQMSVGGIPWETLANLGFVSREELAAMRARLIENGIALIAKEGGADPGPLVSVFQKALASGSGEVEAYLAAMRAARKVIPLGTPVPHPSGVFMDLAKVGGMGLPAEGGMAFAYPGMGEVDEEAKTQFRTLASIDQLFPGPAGIVAEGRFFEWVEKAAAAGSAGSVDLTALQATYVDSVIAGGSITAALTAVIEALPPLAKVVGLPPLVELGVLIGTDMSAYMMEMGMGMGMGMEMAAQGAEPSGSNGQVAPPKPAYQDDAGALVTALEGRGVSWQDLLLGTLENPFKSIEAMAEAAIESKFVMASPMTMGMMGGMGPMAGMMMMAGGPTSDNPEVNERMAEEKKKAQDQLESTLAPMRTAAKAAIADGLSKYEAIRAILQAAAASAAGESGEGTGAMMAMAMITGMSPGCLLWAGLVSWEEVMGLQQEMMTAMRQQEGPAGPEAS